MKSVAKWTLLGVLVYLLLLLVYLPASQILQRLPMPAGVSIYGVSGTVWNGRAEQIQVQGVGIQDVKWSTSVLPLLWARLNLDVRAGSSRATDAISLNGKLGLSLVTENQFFADELTAYIPAALIASRLPLPMPVNAQGRVKLDVEALDYQQGCAALDGQGQWLQAQILLPNQAVDLGNFSAQLSCQNTAVKLHIQSPNRLGLAANVVLEPTGKVAVTGQFKLDPQLPRPFHQSAEFFGQPDPQGYRKISF